MNTSASADEHQFCKISFELDATLDSHQLHAAFMRRQRLLISRVLRDSDAHALYRHLSRDIEWGLAVGRNGAERVLISPEQCRKMDAAQEREVFDIACGGGGVDGAHLFGSWQAREHDSAEISTPLTAFADFMNSSAFLEFVRETTGVSDIRRITAGASCYRAGHFYAFHTDIPHDGRQLGSLVLYLTPRWMHQWGGFLQFRNHDGQFAEAFFPRFNSLSIFLGDQEHAVSCISPFAAEPRYSIGGRLMA